MFWFDLAALAAEHGLVLADVVHVGAHRGEESALYESLGVGRVFWIEANQDLLWVIKDAVRESDEVVWALVADVSGREVSFRVAQETLMSTMYPRYWVADLERTETLVTTTLDDLAALYDMRGANLLVVDAEGGTMDVLVGAERTLAQMDYLILEVDTKGNWTTPQLPEVMTYLRERGFGMVALSLEPFGTGDSLWLRI